MVQIVVDPMTLIVAVVAMLIGWYLARQATPVVVGSGAGLSYNPPSSVLAPRPTILTPMASDVPVYDGNPHSVSDYQRQVGRVDAIASNLNQPIPMAGIQTLRENSVTGGRWRSDVDFEALQSRINVLIAERSTDGGRWYADGEIQQIRFPINNPYTGPRPFWEKSRGPSGWCKTCLVARACSFHSTQDRI